MAAADKAVTKAEVAAEKRFDSVNEFRSAMKDQQGSFADRTQTDFRLQSIESRLDKATGVSLGVSISASIISGMIAATGAVIDIEILLGRG